MHSVFAFYLKRKQIIGFLRLKCTHFLGMEKPQYGLSWQETKWLRAVIDQWQETAGEVV